MTNFYSYVSGQQKQKPTKHKGTGLRVMVRLTVGNTINVNVKPCP